MSCYSGHWLKWKAKLHLSTASGETQMRLMLLVSNEEPSWVCRRDSYWLHPCMAYKLSYNLSLVWKCPGKLHQSGYWKGLGIYFMSSFKCISRFLFVPYQSYWFYAFCCFSEIKRYKTSAFLCIWKWTSVLNAQCVAFFIHSDSSEWHTRRGLPRLEVCELINIRHHSFLWHSSHNEFGWQNCYVNTIHEYNTYKVLSFGIGLIFKLDKKCCVSQYSLHRTEGSPSTNRSIV